MLEWREAERFQEDLPQAVEKELYSRYSDEGGQQTESHDGQVVVEMVHQGRCGSQVGQEENSGQH